MFQEKSRALLYQDAKFFPCFFTDTKSKSQAATNFWLQREEIEFTFYMVEIKREKPQPTKISVYHRLVNSPSPAFYSSKWTSLSNRIKTISLP